MVLTTLIVTLLTGLLFFLVGSVFESMVPALEQDLRWKVKSAALELSHSGDLGVLTRDSELLSRVTARYTDDSDILYIAFEDAQSALLFERGSSTGAPAWSEPNDVAENADAYAVWTPLDVEGMRVGLVRVVVSKARLLSGSQLYRRILWAGLGGATVALALAAMFVTLYIVPILRLTQGAFAELERTTAMALASTRSKGQFLANMSHEIRTPMNGVLGMVHLVQQTPLSHVQRGYIDVIAASARSLLTIVNDILDFSKLEADRYELDPRPCELRQVIEQTVALFEARAREKQLKLDLWFDDDVPQAVVVDGDRLRQVLSNLLSNAVKFTGRGSVSVSVSATQLDAEGSLSLRVRVADTGPGVPKSSEKRLFRAFSQVDGSSSRSHEGTGLGLAISKRLVELMGGTIGYSARDGGGSEFRFEVPVRLSAEVERGTDVPRRVDRFYAQHPVLVVDDNEVNQLVAMEILERFGLEVALVGGGQEAVDAVAQEEYSLVLMDCQMPGVDGYMATRLIREREGSGARLPIVACTAHALVEERRRVEEAGMDDYLSKPIEIEALVGVLARWLECSPVQSGASFARSIEATPAMRISGRPLKNVVAIAGERLPVLDASRKPSARVAEIFLKNTPVELVRLRDAAASDDRATLKSVAHKLKGSSGSIGAARLSAECHRLQVEAETMTDETLKSSLAAVERYYAQVRVELDRSVLEKVTT